MCSNYCSLRSNCEVLTTLTADAGRILSKLHAVQPRGNISFCTGIRVAHVCILHNNTIQLHLIVRHDTEPCVLSSPSWL